MNILVHTIYFPPEVGGLETHVLTLCQALQRRGHEVTVVTSRSMEGTKKADEFEGVPVHRVWCPNRKFTGWVITSLAAIPIMWRLSKKTELIHVHTFPSVVPAIFPRWFRKKPLVATMHTSHFLRLAKKAIWKIALRFLLRQPDIILAPSVEIRDVAVRLAKGIEAYAMVNAVDVQRFKPVEAKIDAENAENIIIVPRRLFEKNGVEFAVRAMPIVTREIDAHLYLIGDGPMKEKLEGIVEELDITNIVHFLGKIPNVDMPAYLSSADLIVIPSLMEATSVAGLESMACERPIVASNVGGLPEIVTNETGRLAEPGNYNDLAHKIIEVLNMTEEEKNKMGATARKAVVERWSTDSLAEQVEAFYVKAMKLRK